MRRFLLYLSCFIGYSTLQAQSFNPSNIPNLALWLRADTGVTVSGGVVTQWNDISGNNYHATQSNATKAPTLTASVPELGNRPAVRFDGVDDVIGGPTIAGLGSSSITFFVVVKGFNTNNATAKDLLTISGVSNGFWIFQGGGSAPNNYFGIRNSNSLISSPNLILKTTGFQNTLLEAVKNYNSGYSFYKNGTLYPSSGSSPGVAGSFTNAPYTIGDGYSAFFKGEIAEMLIYKSALTDTQRTQVEDYISRRYTTPVSLGADISQPYSLCPVTLAATPGFATYLWSSGDTTQQISVNASGQYWVRATNLFDHPTYDTIQVTLPGRPGLNVPDSNLLCIGQSLFILPTMTSYENYNFSWQNGSLDSSITATTEGKYFVLITDTNGCQTSSDTVFVRVDSFANTVSLGPDISICAGNYIHLLSPQSNWNTFSFQWSTGSQDSLLQISTTGDYSLNVTNSNGCIARDTIHITIQGVAPVIDFTGDTLCFGQAYSPLNNSHPADTAHINVYHWNFGNGDTSLAANPSYSYALPGLYNVSLTASTTGGCSASNNETVQVFATPAASYLPVTLCAGVPFQFHDLSSPPTGDTLNAWYWDFDDGNTSSQQNPTHIFQSGGSYVVSLTVTAGNGCSDSDTSMIQVNTTAPPMAAATLLAPINHTTQSSNTVTFSWVPVAGAFHYGLFISAQSNFSTISYSNNLLTDTFAVVSLPTNGKYYWRLFTYNTCNDSTSSAIWDITVFNPSGLPDLALWLCADSGVTVSGGGVTQWNDISGNGYHATQGNTTKSPTFTPSVIELNNHPAIRFDGVNDLLNGSVVAGLDSSSITFFVVAKGFNTNNATAKDLLTISGVSDGFWIYQGGGSAPNNYLGIRNSNSNVSSPTLVLKTTGFQNTLLEAVKNYNSGYSFYKNGTLYPSSGSSPGVAGPFTNAPYTIGDGYSAFFKGEIAEMLIYKTALNDTQRALVENYIYSKYTTPVNLGPDISQPYSLCPITLDAGPRYASYLWSTGDTTQQINAKVGGQYWVRATDVFDRVSSDTIQVVFPFHGLNVNDTTICFPNSVSIYPNMVNTPYHFLWNTSDTTSLITVSTSGVYSCIISDTSGCSTQAEVTIAVDSFVLASILPNDTTVCSGNEVQIDTTISDLASVLWSHGVTHSAATFNVSGQYSVIATDIYSCINRDTIDVTIGGHAPTTDFSATVACFGDTTQLTDVTNTVSPDYISSWHWNFGDGDTSSLQNPSHFYASPGDYNVTLNIVTDSNCTGIVTKLVTSSVPPTAAFTYPNIICAGTPTTLLDNSSFAFGDSIANWIWTFNGIDTLTAQNPSYNFTNAGSYQVKLKVVSTSGCADTASQRIDVFPPFVAALTAQSFCLGDSTLFTDATQSFSIISRQWNFGDQSFFSTEQNPKHKYLAPGIYNVSMRVENAIGCVSTVSRNINIVTPPIANFGNLITCVNTQYTPLDSSVVSNDTIAVWNWTINGQPFNGAAPSYLFTDTGAYPVTLLVRTNNGCTDTVIKTVSVNPLPVAQFYFAPLYGEAPVEVSFVNQSTGASSYLWSFGDSEYSTDEMPVHTYAQNDTFQIMLTAYSAEACADTAWRSFIVSPTNLDLAITEVTALQTQQADGSYLVGAKAKIANLGTRMITNAKFYITIGSGGVISEDWNGILYSGQVMDTVFGAQFVVAPENANSYVCVNAVSVNHGEAEARTDNNIQCSAINQSIQLIGPSPNPVVSGKSYLGLILPKSGQITIDIVDMAGQYIVKGQLMKLPKGRSTYLMPVDKMHAAEYLIRVYYNDDVLTKRFIVGK